MNPHAQPRIRLWLVRHAQPLIEPGICYGQLDVAADAAASQQAAQQLAQALPDDCMIWHSPLQRCELLELEFITQKACSTPNPPTSHADSRLMEMNFGAWEGMSWDVIARTQIDAWANDLAHVAPGGGENLQQMLARVDQALRQTLAASGDITDRVWITHAGVIRCVQWLLQHGQQLPTAAQWQLPAPACGQWICLSLEVNEISSYLAGASAAS